MTECEHGVPYDSPTGCIPCADAYLATARCGHGLLLTEPCNSCTNESYESYREKFRYDEL